MNEFENPGNRALSFLQGFFPDETLYSLCARFHYMSANRLASTTSHQLFGVPDAAMLHDFPAHLSSFVAPTDGLLGDVENLSYDRTLLRFYVPYQPAKTIKAGLEAMAGEGINRLKFRLGLPSSRIGAAHPLKACAKCIREDLNTFGCAYWHLLHQHPAVWICPEHHELLMRSTGKPRTQNKLQWVLPHTLYDYEWKCLPARLHHQSLLLIRLCRFASGILALAAAELDPYFLRQCYLQGAKQAGWLTRSGNVRFRSVRDEFLTQAAVLIDIPEFRFVNSVNGSSGGFLAKLLRNPRSHLHPVKHFLLKTLLFEDWVDFWDCYTKNAEVSYNHAVQSSTSSRVDPRVDAFFILIAAGQKSLAQVARDLDLPYDVARYWLRRAGIVYARPKPPCYGKTG